VPSPASARFAYGAHLHRRGRNYPVAGQTSRPSGSSLANSTNSVTMPNATGYRPEHKARPASVAGPPSPGSTRRALLCEGLLITVSNSDGTEGRKALRGRLELHAGRRQWTLTPVAIPGGNWATVTAPLGEASGGWLDSYTLGPRSRHRGRLLLEVLLRRRHPGGWLLVHQDLGAWCHQDNSRWLISPSPDALLSATC